MRRSHSECMAELTETEHMVMGWVSKRVAGSRLSQSYELVQNEQRDNAFLGAYLAVAVSGVKEVGAT